MVLLEIEVGDFLFQIVLEDIYMNVELCLKQIIGELVGWLYIVWLCNDQVVMDFWLWVCDQVDVVIIGLDVLICVVLDQVEKGVDWVMFGFIYLQIVQFVIWGYYMMVYVEMFGCDLLWFQDVCKWMNELFFGVVVLVGMGFVIDCEVMVQVLGFDCLMVNSFDVVSDWDFVLEFFLSVVICVVYLLWLVEELVIWFLVQFWFVIMLDWFLIGLLIMLQKKNFDVVELIWVKIGWILGVVVVLFVVMKGLFLVYFKDMQEDKEQVFDVVDNLMLVVVVMIGMLVDLLVNKDWLEVVVGLGFFIVIDLVDWLVCEVGLFFCDVYYVIGVFVVMVEQVGVDLLELMFQQM